MGLLRTKTHRLNLPSNSVAAAGNSQATATALASNHVTVSGADGTKGVILNSPTVGQVKLVYNEHASAGLKVYPHVGGDINDGSADAAVTIEGKTLALFWAIDGTTWAAQFTANT